MGPTVDAAYIRRAIELADLDAVRVALYQQTHDEELAALPVALQLDGGGRELLIGKAVDWLCQHAGPRRAEEPPDDELRALMDMATGETMGDLEYESRRDLPAFRDFPSMISWESEAPPVPEGFRVAIIGSGFSGLAMAVQLERLGVPYVVLEKRSEPGGVWSVNRYPDIRVDTISITYEFQFEKDYRWDEYFGRGPEVRAYLDHVARKYGARERTRYDHDVRRATWHDDRHRWVLEVATPDGTETIEADVVVAAVGTFANPKSPDYEGMDDFEGRIVHPSRWTDDIDVRGKRVAVIGNGSTGVQLLAPVAAEAAQVFVFQRTPQWISPRHKYGRAIEPEVRWLFDHFPGYQNWARYMAIAALFQTHRFIVPDEEWMAQGGKVNPLNDKLREDLTAYITAQTGGRQDLIERLVPEYAPFSRRPVVDNGWYAALTRDNVALVTDPIARFTPAGIETKDGSHYDVDLVISATGYQIAKYLWPTEYIGADGVRLHDFWSKDGPRAYLGMMVPSFPNLFMLYGPNSQPVSGGVGLPIWFVIWAAYVARCLERMFADGASSVEVAMDAFERYNDALDEEASKLLILREQGVPHKNYYVNEFGRLQMNAPWYGPDFHRMCTQVAWEDLRLR
jgi:4-hydroxyacetophenone monooxygenase